MNGKRRNLTPAHVIATAATLVGVTPASLRRQRRNTNPAIREGRAAAVFLMRQDLCMSFPAIGRELGFHHSCMMRYASLADPGLVGSVRRKLERQDMLLAIDPASERTGWAALETSNPVRPVLARYGVIRARKAVALDRIVEICSALRQFVAEVRPEAIVIEVPSGHVGRRHGGGGAGLATYGVAVGAIWRELWGAAPIVEAVTEAEWTGGVAKERRALFMAQRFSNYRPDGDTGLDAADAIGLGDWYLAHRKVRAAVKAG